MLARIRRRPALCCIGMAVGLALLSAAPRLAQTTAGSDSHQVGDRGSGQYVFRFETFGNEGFWTDAAKLPQGIVAAGVTPIMALKNGYNINVAALDLKTQMAIAAELKTDLSPANAPMLNSPATTIALINANAVIGVVVKDSNKDGKLDVTNGDKVGVTCAFCHAITDNSVYSMPNGGSIGNEIDGPTPHNLNVGATFALAQNSRALYPLLQLSLTANGGKTIGRAPVGLTVNSSEADVDAYLNNPAYYPIGMFDDGPDGNGAPMHITPLFRTDLSSPWGSPGEVAVLDNFSNQVFVALLDPTTLTTTGGKAFLHYLGGAAGDEIASEYVSVLAATGVTGYPYVQTSPVTPLTEKGFLGLRVDNQKLIDLNAYMDSLPAPAGTAGDSAAILRGQARFTANCALCHNTDPNSPVPTNIVPMATIWPGDNPTVLATRTAPLNPIEDTAGNPFDDKMAVINASIRGLVRGTALPLLMDLARKPVFLHDNSVPDLDTLLNPSRGATAPHPFYFAAAGDRSDMIAYLESLSATSGNTVAFSSGNLGGSTAITAAGTGSVSVGYAVVKPASGNTNPAGVEIFDFRSNGVLYSEAAVPAAPAISSGRIFAEVSSTVNTGIAMVNPSSSSATVSFYFTNSSGVNSNSGSFTLAASQQIAAFVTESPFNLPPGSFIGTMTFSSTAPVAAIALRGSNSGTSATGDYLLSPIPVTDLSAAVSSGTEYIGEFADGGGYATRLVLTNPTDQTQTGSIQFFNQGSGTTAASAVSLTANGTTGSSFAYSIPGRGSAEYLTAGTAATTQIGSIQITPSGGGAPSAYAVFAQTVNGMVISETSVPAEQPGTAFRVFTEMSGVSGNPDTVQSGVIITNTSKSAATVTLALTDVDNPSNAALTTTLTIPASGQTAQFVANLFSGLPANFDGNLRVSSTTSIVVDGFRALTNERGDFLISAIPAVNEATPASTTGLYFPQIADQGGYTTEFVLFSGAASQSTSGTLVFYGQSGSTMPLKLQ